MATRLPSTRLDVRSSSHDSNELDSVRTITYRNAKDNKFKLAASSRCVDGFGLLLDLGDQAGGGDSKSGTEA